MCSNDCTTESHVDMPAVSHSGIFMDNKLISSQYLVWPNKTSYFAFLLHDRLSIPLIILMALVYTSSNLSSSLSSFKLDSKAGYKHSGRLGRGWMELKTATQPKVSQDGGIAEGVAGIGGANRLRRESQGAGSL